MSADRARGFAPPKIVPRAQAILLDIDGTLAGFERDPAAVGPDARRSAILARLEQALDGALAVISGRSLADIDRILDGRVTAAAGVHGLERRRANGALERVEPHPAMAVAIAAFRRVAAEHPGLSVEDKGLGVTLHYRNAPEQEALALETARSAAADTGLALQRGDHVVELRTPGRDKGQALSAFMAEPPFAGRTPVFVGDDLTDEDAFAAAEALGGYGVLVGAARASAARYRLDGVAQVLDWLDAVEASAPSLERA